MRIHVINLDRDPQRLIDTREQFAAAGLAAQVCRVAAIDAQAEDFAAPGYAPRSWRDRWELKRSEQAVFESHRSVWARIAEGDDACGLVCEDDILVSGEMPTLLEALDCDRFGVVKLDGFSADRRYGARMDMRGWTVWEIIEPVPSAACYALSRAAARSLLELSERYCATLDDFLFTARGGLCPVQIDPAVAVQRMCCAEPGGTGVAAGSLREGRDPDRPSRGPLLYRLQKEIRRAARRVASRATPKTRPELADDLPPYAG